MGANAGGYGYLRVNGEQTYAHRFSWSQKNGDIPSGIDILHRCDVPYCVNPEHLFSGTAKDNAQDALKKGRMVNYKGEEHGSAKLTDADVLAIRASKEKQRDTAAKYGVTQAAISSIVRRKVWQHI